MKNLLRIILAGATAFVLSTPLLRAAELVMVEQAGCHYCQRWHAELGPVYPRTPEGAHAPLRRVELGSDDLGKVQLARRVNFTPTFILVDEGNRELARLEGYPGEDFFWGLLEKMLQDHAAFGAGGVAGG